jgi:hypothetical protein
MDHLLRPPVVAATASNVAVVITMPLLGDAELTQDPVTIAVVKDRPIIDTIVA